MFWNKKNKSESEPQLSDDQLAELEREIESETPSRYHHYVLAHVALRTIAHDDPLLFFGVLASEQNYDFLRDVLSKIDQQNDTDDVLDFAAEDIKIMPCSIANQPCIVLEFPTPSSTTEVYLIGVVLKKPIDQIHDGEKPPVDYFTLELGHKESSHAPRTVLCQWTADGAHVNLGDGPPAEFEAFAKTIRTHY